MYSPFYRRSFQIGAAAFLGYALYRVLLPLRGVLGWAAVLAFVLHPLQVWLTRLLRDRPAVAAGILTGLTPFTVLAPLALLGVAFVGQLAPVIAFLRGNSLSYPEIVARLSAYPLIGGAVDWARANATVSAAEVQQWVTGSLQTLLKNLAAVGGNLALGVFGTVVGFFMMLFMLFFFLKDGRAILTSLAQLVPMGAERRARLLTYLGDVTRAVVYGSTATALVAGLMVGVGFAIAGLPSPVVFGVVGTIAAFLPAGAGMVLVPATLYLAVSGRWGAALFLGCWTAGMWIVETVLRPLLTSRHAQVSAPAVFIGAIGGAAAFGILGLLVGPVLMSFTVALVRFGARELDTPDG
jgi:predicted PurR-regulated permease PerM